MNILLWNCNNGINKPKQIDYFKSFQCDLAVIPELKEGNIPSLEPDSAVWVTNNHSNPNPKGLGVLTFNGWQLDELPRDEDLEIYIPLKVSDSSRSFNLLAVWNFYWACKGGRFKDVKGESALEWSAIRHYKTLFNDPSIIIGDWNFGPTFSQEAFVRLERELNESGLTSLYHLRYELSSRQTSHSTFKTTRGNLHHIDHMFGSKVFQSEMRDYSIRHFDEVVLSDHAPSLLEVGLDK